MRAQISNQGKGYVSVAQPDNVYRVLADVLKQKATVFAICGIRQPSQRTTNQAREKGCVLPARDSRNMSKPSDMRSKEVLGLKSSAFAQHSAGHDVKVA